MATNKVSISSSSPELSIEIESLECRAGGTIEGRVHFQNRSNFSDDCRGVAIFLKGEEFASVPRVDTTDYKETIKESHTIIKTGFHFLGRFPRIPTGATEYPFVFDIPEGLPSTLEVRDQKNTQNYGEIRYNLTAAIVPSIPGSLSIFTEARLLMKSDSITMVGRPIDASENFAIMTNLVVSKGHIKLGWTSRSNVLVMGRPFTLQILVENDSRGIEVRDFKIQLIEKVRWQSSHNLSHQVKKTLLESIHLADMGDRPKMFGNLSTWNVTIEAPITATESFQGSKVLVEHEIVVIAQTVQSRTTNPKISHDIFIIPSDT